MLSLATWEAIVVLWGVAVDLVGVEGWLPRGIDLRALWVLWPTQHSWDRRPVFRSQSDRFLDMKPE